MSLAAGGNISWFNAGSAAGIVDGHSSNYPYAVAINPAGTLAYVPNAKSDTVSVINLSPPVIQTSSGNVSLSAGTAGSGSINAFTRTGVLAAGAAGSINIGNTGSVTLSANGSDNVYITNSGAVTTNGSSSAGSGKTFSLKIIADAGGAAGITVGSSASVTAADGKILFTSTGNAPLWVTNNGTIEATGSDGMIGFDGGSSPKIKLGGTGKIIAGGQANFGYLNGDLTINSPFVTVDPPGNITWVIFLLQDRPLLLE